MPKINKNIVADDDFQLKSQPKRKNYRRIQVKVPFAYKQTKKQLIHSFQEQELKISELAKRYHMSYGTVAHIVKNQQQKNASLESQKQKLLQYIKEEAISEENAGIQQTQKATQLQSYQHLSPYIFPYPFWYFHP